MTTKAPAAPTAPKATPKSVTTPIETPQVSTERLFWSALEAVKLIVNETHYGVNKGKGGSTLKDSNSLADTAHDQFAAHGIDYVIQPSDDVKLEVITTPNRWFVVHGQYDVNFTLHGEQVYTTKQFGSFDSDNSSHAAHGALTCARTDLLFTILKAATKSEEDLNANRANSANRQNPRPGATSISNDPY